MRVSARFNTVQHTQLPRQIVVRAAHINPYMPNASCTPDRRIGRLCAVHVLFSVTSPPWQEEFANLVSCPYSQGLVARDKKVQQAGYSN